MTRCFQIVPVANQWTIWLKTSTGLEKKNGGNHTRPNTETVAKNCHSPRATTATNTCRERSFRRDMPTYPAVVPANAGTHNHRSGRLKEYLTTALQIAT